MKISVVVPAYNVEKYIKTCLDSLINQKFKYAFEIIIVDDCSSDKTLFIINQYAQKYKNLIVISKRKKKGPGSARNTALKIAKGEYIFFLDSDDYLSPSALEIAYKKAKRYNADIVTYNFSHTKPGSKKNKRCRKDFNKIKNNKIKLIKNFLSGEIDGSIIFSLIRKKILEKNNITFPNILHEDIPVIFKAYYFSKKTIKINNILYYKVYRKNSIVNKLNKKRIKDIFNSYRILFNFLKKKEKSKIKEFFPYYIKGITGIIGGLIKLNIFFNKKSILKRKEIYRYIFNNIKKDIHNVHLPNKTYKDKISKIFYNIYSKPKKKKSNLVFFEKEISKIN